MFPPKVHFDDDNGAPLDGGKIFTYKANEVTLINKDTYTDKAMTTPHANPIILDARGEAEVWLDGEYKCIIKDKIDVEIDTVDEASTETVTGADTDAEWFSPGQIPTFITGTSFSVEDDQTAIYHEGRRVRCEVTAGTVYGVVKIVAFTSLTTVTVVLDAGALDSGLSVVDVGILSAQNQSYPIQQIQYGGYAYIPDTGAADAYIALMAPPLYEYKTGFTCKILMANANTVINPTIDINGLGPKVIKKQTGVALVANDIITNQIVDLVYDGTDFILLNENIIKLHDHSGSETGGLVAYPIYSDGNDGAFSSGGSGNIDGDILNHTTYTVNSGHTLTINTGKGIIVIASESITIAGTIDASGLGEAGGVTDNDGVSSSFGSGTGGGGGADGAGATGGDGGDATFMHRTLAGGAKGTGIGGNGANGASHPIANYAGIPPEGLRYGAGGGSGKGNGSVTPYNGGGFMAFIAPIVTIEATATLNTSGDSGANGGASSGGHGGCAGGDIFIITHNYTDNGGTLNTSGGTGGTSGGTGGDGGDGGDGITRIMEL